MTTRQQHSLGQSWPNANSSFRVDDTADSAIAASCPVNATEASYEVPTVWHFAPRTTERLTFNHVFHYQVVGARGNGKRYANPTSFSHNAAALNARSIDPSRSTMIRIGTVSEHTAAGSESLGPKRFSISGTALQGFRDGPRLRGAGCCRFGRGRVRCTIRRSLLPNSNQTQVQCYSLPGGAAPRLRPWAAYAGNVAVAEVAQPSEQPLLSNLHHA
jgi:hypothetical protein